MKSPPKNSLQSGSSSYSGAIASARAAKMRSRSARGNFSNDARSKIGKSGNEELSSSKVNLTRLPANVLLC